MKLIIIFFALVFSLPSNLSAQPELKIYGGKNHDQFLGCLTCADDDLNSIWCIFGDYGSSRSAKSIWNEIGPYGSDTSAYSPFNINSLYPPILLDKDGKSYGYFTVNIKFENRSKLSIASIISEDRKRIREDVTKWYHSLFNH